MTTYTDDQACIVAGVVGLPMRHRKTIPAWAARDKVQARVQSDAVRAVVRAEVGPDLPISVLIIPGYCAECAGAPVAPPVDPALHAIAVMVKALAAQNGYAENTSSHTSAEVREAWRTVLELSR